jgi:hypothetical protein
MCLSVFLLSVRRFGVAWRIDYINFSATDVSTKDLSELHRAKIDVWVMPHVLKHVGFGVEFVDHKNRKLP